MAVIVITPPELVACTSSLSGMEVSGSVATAALIAAAMPTAIVTGLADVVVYETGTELTVVTRTSPAAAVPPIVAVHDAGTGGAAVYVPSLPGSSEHASMNGAPASAAVKVTTADPVAASATTRPLSGRPEYGSATVVALTAAAMPAAMVSAVSPATTWYCTCIVSIVVISRSPVVTGPATVALHEAGVPAVAV
jgi:hypothetical protein